MNRQLRTIVKHVVTDARHAIGNRERRQTLATRKCVFFDSSDLIRKFDLGKPLTLVKRGGTDGGHAVGNRHMSYMATIRKRARSDANHG